MEGNGKRTIVVLSAFILLLLAAAGVLAAGSVRQAEWLANRAQQVGELNQRLRQQRAAYEEQILLADEAAEERAALLMQRDEIAAQLRDALMATEELNAAVQRQSAQLEAERAAFHEERGDWNRRLDEMERRDQEQMGRVNALTAQRDELQSEIDAFSALLELKNTLAGAAGLEALREAEAAFAQAYPLSPLALPLVEAGWGGDTPPVS